MASPKIPGGWTWLTSVLALAVFLDLCALTWYFWAAPEEFQTLEKILPTVGSWLVTILTFFGIRYKFRRGQSIEQVLRIRPVQLCIIAFTILIWFFVLPFHSITVSIRQADSSMPISQVSVKVDDEKAEIITLSDEDGKIKIGGLLATNHKLRLEKQGYKTRDVTISFLHVIGFWSVHTVLEKIKTYPLTVSSDPQGAQIYVDGVPKGITLDKITLTAGEHTIDLRKTRYKPAKKVVRIPDPDMDTIIFNLEKDIVRTQP